MKAAWPWPFRYGQSEGSPFQKGLQLDSEAALEHVLQRQDVDTSRIVLYGKSLGGAVALHLAAAHQTQLRAAIVENTFTSVEHMVPRVFPALGILIGKGGILNCLVRNKWQNYQRIQEIGNLPLMLIGSVQVRWPPPKRSLGSCAACILSICSKRSSTRR